MDSHSCDAWCRVRRPDEGSFHSHPLDPGQHYLTQALDAGASDLHQVPGGCKPCGKMNAGITLQSLVTTPNIMTWTVRLVFINIGKFCGDIADRRMFFERIIENFSYLRKTKPCSVEWDACVR